MVVEREGPSWWTIRDWAELHCWTGAFDERLACRPELTDDGRWKITSISEHEMTFRQRERLNRRKKK